MAAAISLVPLETSTPASHPKAFVPPVPWRPQDTGLPASLLEQLIFNHLHARGELSGRVLADALGLSFSAIEPIMDELKSRQSIEVKSSLGYGQISSLFALSENGRKRLREYSGSSQYTGPAPVPLAQYNDAVTAQRRPEDWVTKEDLDAAFQHMEVSPQVLSHVGPAVNSGKSFLIYGQPGNGKTYLAESLTKLQSADVFIPYALEHKGTIVRVFDPLYHHPVAVADESLVLFSLQRSYDSRWVRCRIPFIATGGELSAEMLELSYNDATKIYDAPFHVKANNGIYLIDDFGRQKITPSELLNRWIVPLESRVDHLVLPTGGKLAIPFQVFLVFSTNLRPSELGDEAFLRRIQYKMFIKNPSVAEFRRIFLAYCQTKGLDCPETLLDDFVTRRYLRPGKPFRRCHARDVISHAIAFIKFEKCPYRLTLEILDAAFDSCFAQEEDAEL